MLSPCLMLCSHILFLFYLFFLQPQSFPCHSPSQKQNTFSPCLKHGTLLITSYSLSIFFWFCSLLLCGYSNIPNILLGVSLGKDIIRKHASIEGDVKSRQVKGWGMDSEAEGRARANHRSM